jgi:hypothetical protein
MNISERDKLIYMFNVVRKERNLREVDNDYFETLTNDEIAREISEILSEGDSFDIRDV